MKNKLTIIFTVLAILVAALTGYLITKDNGATEIRLRSSGALNNFIIESIQNSTNNPVSQEDVTITVRTEWDGLYFETTNTSSSPSALTTGDAISIIENTITPSAFLANLVPEADEATSGTGINPPVDPKILQYVVGSTAAAIGITADNITILDGSGKVYEALDPTTKYDFVFVVEANTPSGNTTSNTNIKNALTEFTNYLNTNNYTYRTNIIEIGGKKAVYKEVGTTKKYNIHDATGTYVITNNNPVNNYVKFSYYDLLYSNMVNQPGTTEKLYPQDVRFSDVLYPTASRSEFFLQRYNDWLSSSNISKAIGLIGKYNLADSTSKTGNGSNGIFGLSEAVNFLETNKDITRKQVIVFVGNKEMDAIDKTSKDAFVTWFNNKILANNFLVLNSTPLSKSNTLDGNPYVTTSIDRLGHNIDGTYVKADNKLYLLGLKAQLLDKLYEYESGSNQGYLKDILYNFIGHGRYYQKWYIKFRNSTPDTNQWKKLLFSLGDFTINYDDGNTANVKTTTILKKPMAEADTYFYPGKSAEILADSRYKDEKYYDRFYYTNKNPTIITFTNPDENTIVTKYGKSVWTPNSQQKYILTFNFSKADNSSVLPAGTALTSLKLTVKNGNTTIIGASKTYTREDIVTNETTLGGWGLTVSKDKYLVSVYFSDTEFKAIQEEIKSKAPAQRLYGLTFDVTGTINNELVHDSVDAYVDILPPEITGVTTAQNQSAKLILKALDIFKDKSNDVENAYITALTSADANGDVYIRNDPANPGYITFSFTIYDDNPANDALKYYDTVIHAKIASNFIGQHIVTTMTSSGIDNEYVDVDISGELKTDTILRSIPVQDSFGNSTELKVIDAVIKFLSDPVPRTASLDVNNIRDYSTDSTVVLPTDMPKKFVKGSINPYNLNFSNASFDDGKIVGLILPFKQNKDKADVPTDVSYFGQTSEGVLRYETWPAASFSLTSSGIDITYNVNSLTMDSKKGSIRYDGIYELYDFTNIFKGILPVNRAGGIAGFVYDDALLQAIPDVDTNLNLVDTIKDSVNATNIAKISPIGNTEKYVVDTLAPRLNSIYKTGATFKDVNNNSIKYQDGTHFDVPVINGSEPISSGGYTTSYKKTLFTGQNLKPKTEDIYTIVLDDYSLGVQNINPGNIGAPTPIGKPNAKYYRFYTYKINEAATSGAFDAQDLADNISEDLSSVGDLINHDYSDISNPTNYYHSTSSGGITKKFIGLDRRPSENPVEFPFTNLTDNLFNVLSYASAATYNTSRGTVIPKTQNYFSVTNGAFTSDGEKIVNTYNFNSAGWVKKVDMPLVYDTQINTTNLYLPKVIMVKTPTPSNTWKGTINFGNIFEYAGLTSFSIKEYPTINGSFSVYASNTISSTKAQVTTSGGESKPITLTYTGTDPSVKVKVILTDQLGNTGEFNVELILTNPLKLIGTSIDANKQIQSTIDLNELHNFNIKNIIEKGK